MPKGIFLDKIYRRLIDRFINIGFSTIEIFNVIFNGEERILTFRHLELIVKKLSDPDNSLFRESYLIGSIHRGGRPLALAEEERIFWVDFVLDHKYELVREMRNTFIEIYYGDNNNDDDGKNFFCLSTAFSELHKAELSRKVMVRKHIRRNDIL